MITMVDSVKTEMVWSSLAMGRAVVAELRPVSGKTGCAGRFRPTPAMRANRGGAQDRGDHVDVAGND